MCCLLHLLNTEIGRSGYSYKIQLILCYMSGVCCRNLPFLGAFVNKSSLIHTQHTLAVNPYYDENFEINRKIRKFANRSIIFHFMLTVACIWIKNLVRKNEKETKKVDDQRFRTELIFYFIFIFPSLNSWSKHSIRIFNLNFEGGGGGGGCFRNKFGFKWSW